jgi:inorganic triphosphatase YgiF
MARADIRLSRFSRARRTYEFLPDPAGTKLRLTCNVAGQWEDGEDKIVDAVWHHFLTERLKPYIESGAYKKKTP